MTQTPTLIILAGGASSRMWPLREKSLMRFGAEPLLINRLQHYAALGFSEVVIIANPDNHEEITTHAAQVKALKIHTAIQQEPRGMGDALLQAAPLLEDRPGTPIYITQVHDVVDDRLHLDMLRAYQAAPDSSFLAGYEMEAYFPGGYLIVEQHSGRINGIIEKPGADRRPSNLVNIVAHIHRDAARLLAAIREEYQKDLPGDDHYERAMDVLMKEHVYRVVPYNGPWKALKYPWHTLDVMEYFLTQINGQHIAESAFIASGATITGNVFIAENVRVFPGAAVVGPAFIGANTIVGNNSLVRHSMVLNNCEVGFTTEIARSYVAERCAMHACRVLDSVFAPGVNFSAGCTSANLRIDRGDIASTVKGQKLSTGRNKLGAIIGQDAFLGVDVMTMPGVKIGEHASIGPGTHVHRDIKDRQRVYVKQEIIVEDEPS